jgi:hypothetical protein
VKHVVLVAVATALVALSATGCGVTVPPRSAHVAGTVRLCGVLGCFPEWIHVSVLDASGRAVESTRSANGRFSLNVPPGSYDVSVATRRYLVGTVTVDAVAGQTARVDLTDRRLG